jgi:hypothetical protein
MPDGVGVGAGFLVAVRAADCRAGRVGDDGRVRPGLQLTPHGAVGARAIVHLRVDRHRDLVGQVCRADDQTREAAHAGRGAERRPRAGRRCAVTGLYAQDAGERIERRILARAGDETRLAQVQPEIARLGVAGSGVVGAPDHTVAVAVIVCRDEIGPARRRLVIVARDAPVAVLVAVVGRRNAREVGDRVLDLGLRDHLLAFEDAAEQQPDDHEDDGDLDQGESAFSSLHGPLLGHD